MNELEFVKGLVDSGILAVLVMYIRSLDNQRNATEIAHRQREQATSDARAEDNNRWLNIFARQNAPQAPIFTSKSPTSLE